MLGRLGNVLFGLSVLIAIGWTWGIVDNAIKYSNLSDAIGPNLIIAAPSLLIGWGLRYILSGRVLL
jgi:hypothetical protein